ncbi:cleavage and polyadenylation specificity factor cpsf30-like [Stylonychia lemnae]|uniref:Cleavage and polyadenylation specificity factor cpsf30-like n=1 Tax=Stylonychia lemnae TaxID=5949 RepID=A0A077ZSV1_STYLE|nr:cleavage and polyadenylation specificity factor cpsf30-like [Stylonychia lemnae]|eukprot:CDW72390.1 cleavage and polyadenylation specificity factor cpsf30-like [Stylonychia lemnae]
MTPPQYFMDQIQRQFQNMNKNNFVPVNQNSMQMPLGQQNPQLGIASLQIPQQLQQMQIPKLQKFQIECQDYNQGFCINGPACQYQHIKKPESSRPKKVQEQYIKKVYKYFQNDGMTNHYLLLELLNSVLINKLQDTQSINISLGGGTFSDVMSERSDHHYFSNYSQQMAREIDMIIENTKPIMKGRTRFFVVKSFNTESLLVSQKFQVWATSAGPTKKLTNAFKTSDHVVLIFSVNESRSFQGFALMESEPDPSYLSDYFKSDQESPIQYAGNFKVRWVVQGDYQFKDLEHLPLNPMNENMPIKQSKNGQELPFKLGNYLCYLIYHQKDPKKQILTTLEVINQMPVQFTMSQQHNYNQSKQGGQSYQQSHYRQNNNNTSGGGNNSNSQAQSSQQQYQNSQSNSYQNNQTQQYIPKNKQNNNNIQSANYSQSQQNYYSGSNQANQGYSTHQQNQYQNNSYNKQNKT